MKHYIFIWSENQAIYDAAGLYEAMKSWYADFGDVIKGLIWKVEIEEISCTEKSCRLIGCLDKPKNCKPSRN